MDICDAIVGGTAVGGGVLACCVGDQQRTTRQHQIPTYKHHTTQSYMADFDHGVCAQTLAYWAHSMGP